MPVSSLIENAFKVFGLDLNGIMCDNILAYLPCVCSIFATLKLSPDPTYDPNANKSGWELFWQGLAEWFNNLSNEQKIGWGIVALLAACLVAAATSFATGGTSWAMLAAMANVFMEFAVGVISYVALSTCMALISGGDVAETISNSTADAIFLGGIFSFVSAGINAVKVGIRSSYNAKLPGSLAVGAQPQSVANLPWKGYKQFDSRAKLEEHFANHGKEFGDIYKTADEYLVGANYVIKNGTKVTYIYKGNITTGYVKFFGNSINNGAAKFAFVGLQQNGNIATYHIKIADALWKTLGRKGVI